MKRIVLPVLALLVFNAAHSQNTFRAIIKDSTTKEVLDGASASLKADTLYSVTNQSGEIVISGVPDGRQVFVISHVGYQTKEFVFNFPLPDTATAELLLVAVAEALDEVVVQGTRSNRSIANTPTRVEVLTEEIDEAATMDPSKVAHLLTHSTGIQVQQTSATSNTANVRIQGLDGRYTQILKDGFPLYGGFSGSLSIMQIPPLDLRQIEYIKGGASTLYGGGAISGLINLISKEPTTEETLIHLNASHIGAFDVNSFVSKKTGNSGFTLLAQRNTHKIFDADKDGYSDCPQLTKYNFNPKLFFYFSDRTRLSAGATFTNEKRQGGDVNLVNNEATTSDHYYKEVNDISRITTQIKFDHKPDTHQTITVRNSFNIFKRSLSITPSFSLGEYRFAGKQLSSFSEATYSNRKDKNIFIAGMNFYTDDFNETALQSAILRNEDYKTLGTFVNYTFDIGDKLAIESGLRTDYVFDEKWYVLPRISVLFKWTKNLTTRVGSGMGYRNASIFNQEAELLGYRNVMPVDKNTTHAEKSYGGNIDIGYKVTLGENYFIHFNQMFFYTYLDKPLILLQTTPSSGVYNFMNAIGYTRSAGAETFFKFGFYDFVLFVGYTYTNATNHFNNTKADVTLTPRHSLKGDLLYAIPGKWRIGVDYEFKSSQALSNGLRSRSFWTFGAVIEYTWKNYTLFGNVENYTNLRQTDFGSLKSAPYNTPQFTEVWAPLDGIVFNYGLKIRL
ncbi:TonB-dependent receptor [Terrimonas pollutisoli]|uniref:TonB-dependent receptor n=1 Tax=Terrimonas pollutisoli TaxID=3034147 RepID=UPI0023EC4A08|nr:TonB-dependent receptor plug domain-containing protein [Terrimonas sp. H1YJ31]